MGRNGVGIIVAAAVALAAPSLTALGADHADYSADGRNAATVYVHAASADAASDAARRAGLRVVHRLQALPVAVATGPALAVRELSRDRRVTHVERERRFHYYLDSSRAAVRATDAISHPVAGGPFDGRGQTIAVVDTGVDGTHPMFQNGDKSAVVRNLKLMCFDHVGVYASDPAFGEIPPRACPDGGRFPHVADSLFVDVTAVNDSDTMSAGGHGTHVASIAAGRPRRTANGLAVAGIAPAASVLAISIGTYAAMLGPIAAFDWLVRHHRAPCGPSVSTAVCPPVTVVNASWGPTGGDAAFNPQDAIVQLQRRLVAAGVVVVFGNGNGDLTGNGGDGTTNMSNTFGIDPTPGVITVATYDDAGVGERDGTVTGASSRGQRGQPDTYPDLVAPGGSITGACRAALTICRLDPANPVALQTDPKYAALTGSSMSAPHVTGAVALLRQARPDLTPPQIEDVLEDTAHRFATAAPVDVDPSNPTTPTSFDEGHGLLDIAAALEAATGAARSAPAPRCPPDITGASDPRGEKTPIGFVPGVLPYDSALDIVDARLTSSPAAGMVRFVMTVADLRLEDPSYSTGLTVAASFSDGRTTHSLRAVRTSADGLRAWADNAPAVAAVDVVGDQIAVVAPRSAFSPPLGGRFGASAVQFSTRREVVNYANVPVVVNPVFDLLTMSCPIPLDVGGVGASGYDAVLSAASPNHEWRGEPNTDSAILTLVGVCFGASSRTCEGRRVFVAEAGMFKADVKGDRAAADFDVCISAIEPPGATVCGRELGQADHADMAVTPGLYQVTVRPIVAVESGYKLRVSLAP